MSIADTRRLDEDGSAARDRHQAGGFANLFADDFTYSEVTVPEALRSKDQVRQYIQSWFTAFPDMQLRSINPVVGGEAVGTDIGFTGTNTGPFVVGAREVPATGTSVRGAGSCLASVREAKSSRSAPTPMWLG